MARCVRQKSRQSFTTEARSRTFNRVTCLTSPRGEEVLTGLTGSTGYSDAMRDAVVSLSILFILSKIPSRMAPTDSR